MLRGCSPSLDDKRREAVISKITAIVAKRVMDLGVLLDKNDLTALSQAVGDLYAAADTPLHGTSSSSTGSVSRSLPRPQSAASSLAAGAAMVTKSVSQAQIDQLVQQFAAERKAIVSSILQEAERNKTSAPSKGLPPRPSTANVPSMTVPRAVEAPAALDPKLFLTATQLREMEASPACVSPMMVESTGAESPMDLGSNTYLQRSMSSMRASTASILQLVGTEVIPASKRHRRILRDAEAYQAAQQAREEADRDKQRQKQLRLQRQSQLRAGLDSQCQEHRELERSRQVQRDADRQAQIQASEDYHNSQKELRTLKRTMLAKQLRLNEQLRQDRVHMALTQKKAEDEDEFEGLQFIAASSVEQVEMDKARRECQQNFLAQQMHDIEEGKRSLSAMRIQELRLAKQYQAKLNEQLDQQERKRQEQRAVVQKKVQLGEARAMRQYALVEGAMSADDKKDKWLSERLARDVQQLQTQAETRSQSQQSRKAAANTEMLRVLRKQMEHREHLKLQDKNQSCEVAREIQNGLDLMIVHDAAIGQQSSAEKHEWLQVLDAQCKAKTFKETRDIETCIPRSDVLTKSISSLHTSPSRCATALW